MNAHVHWVDSRGNLEWVERIIDAKRYMIRRGKFHLTEQELREILRLAYRNGAGEHERVLRSAFDAAGRLIPGEKP